MEAAQPPAQSSLRAESRDMEVAASMPYSAPNIVFRMRWMIGIALLAIAASTVALTGSRGAPPAGRAPPPPPVALPGPRAALRAAAPPVAPAETLPSLNPALADLAARSPHKRVEV